MNKRVSNNNILVIGEECRDVFVYGNSNRLCPDVPAPVFIPTHSTSTRGMAGNTERNLKALGQQATKITQMTQSGKTIKKTRYIESKVNYTFLRVDEGEDTVEPYVSNLSEEAIRSYDAIAISDYGKGFLSELDIEKFCKNNANTFLDTKKTLGDFCREAKIIKINSPEYEAIKNKINEKEWVNKLIVTLGDRGCMYQKDNGFNYYPVDTVDVFDLSGAGDTFLAALITNYLESNNMDDAINFANKKSSEVIQERGVTTAMPDNHPKYERKNAK